MKREIKALKQEPVWARMEMLVAIVYKGLAFCAKVELSYHNHSDFKWAYNVLQFLDLSTLLGI